MTTVWGCRTTRVERRHAAIPVRKQGAREPGLYHLQDLGLEVPEDGPQPFPGGPKDKLEPAHAAVRFSASATDCLLYYCL